MTGLHWLDAGLQSMAVWVCLQQVQPWTKCRESTCPGYAAPEMLQAGTCMTRLAPEVATAARSGVLHRW